MKDELYHLKCLGHDLIDQISEVRDITMDEVYRKLKWKMDTVPHKVHFKNIHTIEDAREVIRVLKRILHAHDPYYSKKGILPLAQQKKVFEELRARNNPVE